MRGHLYGKEWFPKVDYNGAVYLTMAGVTGRAAKKKFLEGKASSNILSSTSHRAQFTTNVLSPGTMVG